MKVVRAVSAGKEWERENELRAKRAKDAKRVLLTVEFGMVRYGCA